MSTQTRVLRAIQEGEFERVGGTKTLKVDVRIVAATHRDLLKMIEESKFRQDLYYRLNVVPIQMPTLSQRMEDIPLLADYFLDMYCRENGTMKKKFSQDAMALLMSASYPGEHSRIEKYRRKAGDHVSFKRDHLRRYAVAYRCQGGRDRRDIYQAHAAFAGTGCAGGGICPDPA